MDFKEMLSLSVQKTVSDILFILYAGGVALLSYSLVYTFRKTFTAVTYDRMELFGVDFKIATLLRWSILSDTRGRYWYGCSRSVLART